MNLRLHRDELSKLDSDYDPLNDTSLDKELVQAVTNNDINKVKDLIDQGADIHWLHESPMEKACGRGYVNIVKLLIERGADINFERGRALRLAVYCNHFALAKFLLDMGMRGQDGRLSFELYEAESTGHTNMAKLLRKYLKK